MNILAEIHRSPGINVKGKTIHRTAVRGVILRGKNLLMIHSSHVGDYKFPGGGMKQGETYAQALYREVQEECGMCIVRFGLEIGAVIEFNIPIEKDYDAFKMTSHYYLCDVGNEFGAQKLDHYEQELGYEPVWIDLNEVIQLNKILLHSNKTVEWLRRETLVLEYIQQDLLLKPGT